MAHTQRRAAREIKRAGQIERTGYVLVLSDDEPANAPCFASTSCSECGDEFGAGSEGFSHCEDHKSAVLATFAGAAA